MMRTSIKTFLRHTAAYYKMQLTPQKISIVTTYSVMAAAAAVGASVVTARAGVAKWELIDVMNEDVYESAGVYYALEDDAPELTERQFHLQMPMSLEGFLSESVYASEGVSDPEHPKLDELVEMTADKSYFANYNLEIPTDEELGDEDYMEFVESRPPQSVLK